LGTLATPGSAWLQRPMSAAADTTVAGIVASFAGDRLRLLDIAHAVQAQFGCIDAAAVDGIAAGLGIHAVEVEDMVSFYALFSREKQGRFHIRFSNTPVSMLKGAQAVADAFAAELGVAVGETTADGAFTLGWTSDIGMADQEPSALVNGMVLTSLAPGDVPAIVATLRQGGVPPQAVVASSLVQAGKLLSGTRDGVAGLAAALDRSPEQVVAEITTAKLRGRGGAGFPTGMKWRLSRKAIGDEHYVVCNADEGEPGTFKDRVLLTEFADLMFEGMTIAGYALGARHGLVYLRGEYAYLWDHLQAVLQRRRDAGLLGAAIQGRVGFDFDIRLQLGAGAYICGEESSLLESLEGKRGAPRDRPPFPTERGYMRQPTAVDNVETFVCAARILEHGAAWFTADGTAESAGTKLMSVSGDCARPGVYEVPFGITVNELLDLVSAADAEFVQVGGPSGQSVAPRDFGRRIAYEDLSTGGSTMVFGPQRDVLDIALQFARFFVDESCGWCTPCRVGTTLLQQGMQTIVAGRATLADIAATEALANTVARMSRCGLGQTAPNPILSTMRSFLHLYEARLRPEAFVPRLDLAGALQDAVVIQARDPAPAEL
jgi:[NiFe] hydrogenase diaphorase moiety large subunit